MTYHDDITNYEYHRIDSWKLSKEDDLIKFYLVGTDCRTTLRFHTAQLQTILRSDTQVLAHAGIVSIKNNGLVVTKPRKPGRCIFYSLTRKSFDMLIKTLDEVM